MGDGKSHKQHVYWWSETEDLRVKKDFCILVRRTGSATCPFNAEQRVDDVGFWTNGFGRTLATIQRRIRDLFLKEVRLAMQGAPR